MRKIMNEGKERVHLLTPVNLEQEHGRDVDGLEDDELDGMNGSDGEGGGLLVGVVQLVEVDVHEWQVEDTMTPISKVILKRTKIVKLMNHIKIA
jgi:hypothetical protein